MEQIKIRAIQNRGIDYCGITFNVVSETNTTIRIQNTGKGIYAIDTTLDKLADGTLQSKSSGQIWDVVSRG